MSLFESTLLSFCKPQSIAVKLDLPTLRHRSRERKNATEQVKNMTLARICILSLLIYIYMYIYARGGHMQCQCLTDNVVVDEVLAIKP